MVTLWKSVMPAVTAFVWCYKQTNVTNKQTWLQTKSQTRLQSYKHHNKNIATAIKSWHTTALSLYCANPNTYAKGESISLRRSIVNDHCWLCSVACVLWYDHRHTTEKPTSAIDAYLTLRRASKKIKNKITDAGDKNQYLVGRHYAKITVVWTW